MAITIFGQLPWPVFMKIALAFAYEMQTRLDHRNAPDEGEKDKKFKKNFSKNFLRRKNFTQ